MSELKRDGIGAPLRANEAKFLCLLFQLGAISGTGVPVEGIAIYNQGLEGLTDDQKEELGKHRKQGKRLKPELEKLNCLTLDSIKTLGASLKTMKWSRNEPPYLTDSAHYCLNGDTCISTGLQAVIAVELSEASAMVPEGYVLRSEFVGAINTVCAAEVLERELNWLVEHEYIDVYSQSIRASRKLKAQIKFIRRVVEFVNRRNQSQTAETIESSSQSRSRDSSPVPAAIVTTWDNAYFKITPATDGSVDLRICSTALHSTGIIIDDLAKLIEAGARIEMLLMDPDRWDLIVSRNRIRTDKGKDPSVAALAELTGQIDTFSNLGKFPRPQKGVPGGSFDLRVSDLLPLGSVLLTRDRAFLGLFWTRNSYGEGKMIEVGRNSELGKDLSGDWTERWQNSWEPGGRPLVKPEWKGPQLSLMELNQFFGDVASTRADEASIIVSADTIDRMLAITTTITAEDRVYKARNWINRWDYDGADAIRREFRRHGLKAPTLSVRRHHGTDDRMAPVQFSIGLTFAAATTGYLGNVCEPWLLGSIGDGDWGDTIYFHKDITGVNMSRFGAPDGAGFRRCLPRGWESPDCRAADYIRQWQMNERPEEARTNRDVWDYAVILRHTEIVEGRRTVHFVLSGFTERGTAVAGRYLAYYWPQLWDEFVKGNLKEASMGDFLVLIEGKSNPDTFKQWGRAASITRANLDKFPNCEWSKRTSQ